jgi:hypothetical protein
LIGLLDESEGDNEMKDKHVALLDEKNLNEQPKKASYSSPVLKIYGAVSKLTMGSGSIQGDSGPQSMTATMTSDRDTKENIVRIGEHPLGIGLYLFDYKPEFREEWGSGRQFGVMADEVETVMPEAIVVHPDGYKMVNYGMLGVYHTIQ